MFKTLISLLILLMLTTSLTAQSTDLKGRMEYSVSFSYQSMKQKDAEEASWIMNLPFHLNYFVSENIGVGAEINFTDAKGIKNTGIILNILVEANFPIRQGKSIPFLLAGYGYSNGSFIYDRMAIKNFQETDIGVLNLGAGLKLFITEKIYARIEGRYQNFSGESENTYFYGAENEISITYFRLFMGFSIIL
jgi:opacity protein-like surface antigen